MFIFFEDPNLMFLCLRTKVFETESPFESEIG